jgi:hypothetical protein
VRACRVSVTDLQGVTHSTEVQASSLFEAAAGAIAAFKLEGWAAEALKPNTILRVEIRLPSVIHDVPLRAVEQWLQSTSASPKEEIVKRRFGK